MRQLLLNILFFPLFVNAQIVMPIDIPSPNASDLGRYGNIPVSYYTGTPEISIPLYNLEVRGVNFSIFLSYNAGGVLVNKLPGWLGDNWSLSAGGVITRVVQGTCDEYVYSAGEGLNYNTYNYFQSCGSLKNHYLAGDYGILKDSIEKKVNDFSPDIFYFNLMGMTGRFFFGNDGQWKMFCDQNIDILFDVYDPDNYIDPFLSAYPDPSAQGTQPKTIKGFTLRDENGTCYIFGGDTNSIEYSIPIYNLSDCERSKSWTANSWYLKEIRDRFGNLLYSLNYVRGKFIVQMFRAAWFTAASNSAQIDSGNFYERENSHNLVFQYDGVLNAPVYLSSLVAANGKTLQFDSSNLDVSMMQIYNSLYSAFGNPSLCANMQFFCQNYFANLPFYYLQTNSSDVTPYQYNSTSTAKSTDPLITTRLRKLESIRVTSNTTNGGDVNYYFDYNFNSRFHLVKIQLKDKNNIKQGVYQLNYNQYNSLPSEYISPKEDHWGYYNNHAASQISFNPSNTSAFWNQISNYESERETNTAYSTIGMLTEIVYPTGGKSVFSYEHNRYSRYQSRDRQLLVNSSGVTGGVRVKSIMEYDNTTTPKLLRSRTFTYIDPSNGQDSGELFSKPCYLWQNWKSTNVNSSTSTYLSLFKSTSILPLSNSFGPHVGYSYVKETFGDGSYKIYHFSNLSDVQDQSAIYNFCSQAESPFDVFSERDYKRGKLLSVKTYNASGGLIQSIENTYRTDNVENDFVYTTNLKCSNFNTALGGLRDFTFFTGGIYKLYYPRYDIVQKTMTTISDSGTLYESINYNREDVSLAMTDNVMPHTINIRKMLSEAYTLGANTRTTTYTYPYSTSINIENNLASQFFLKPLTVATFSNGVQTSKRQTTYKTYNGKIVPYMEINEAAGGERDTLVTYNNYTNTYRVNTYKEIGQPITTLTWTNNDHNLLTKQTGVMKTICTYTGDNRIKSVTEPNGNIIFYEYDAMGRLSAIKDKNQKVIRSFSYNCVNK